MLSFLPAPLVGAIVGFLFFLNILVMAFLVVLLGLIKYIVPFKAGRKFLTDLQNDVVTPGWISVDSALLRLAGKTKWIIQGEGELHPDHWYFVFANHQSWTDIIVMQKIFNHKIPLLKFFLKQELLWTLPMGGLACWMLDFPFMKRHTKAYLKKHPEKRNSDMETTRASCNKFKTRPTAVMNFLEGTRFTKQKQQDRSSPYKNLLRPKAGGLAFVISELQDYIKEVVDVTIAYSHPDPTFWNLVSGKISKIIVNYRVIALEPEQYGDYYNNQQFRRQFQAWVNDIWSRKDNLLNAMIEENKT